MLQKSLRSLYCFCLAGPFSIESFSEGQCQISYEKNELKEYGSIEPL